MRILNSLYGQGHGTKVALQKGSLLVTRRDATRVRVPIESLEAVVLLGSSLLTTDAIAACVERGIRVTSLRRGGRVQFVVGGPAHGNVHLRQAQFGAASNPLECAQLARWFVAGKLQNYRRLLGRWRYDIDEPGRTMVIMEQEVIENRLQGLTATDDGDRIRGIEGDATRRYFKALTARLDAERSGLRFGIRTRRPPRDPVNALLSFMYGLLTTEISGALEAVGLDLQIGFLHGARPGRPALALDVLEEFRPAIADRFALRLIGRHQLRAEHFVNTAGGACYLTEEGRSVVFRNYDIFKGEEVLHRLLGRAVPRWTLPSVQATLLARFLRGDLPAYPPYVIET
ncbi:MAG TPA: CRISPR-associated endonuclease Cas1 [Actinomycetota bacterium]|nr:CRISPR-associated endonuclease Cas1 [Actinomycetota bacterium]